MSTDMSPDWIAVANVYSLCIVCVTCHIGEAASALVSGNVYAKSSSKEIAAQMAIEEAKKHRPRFLTQN